MKLLSLYVTALNTTPFRQNYSVWVSPKIKTSHTLYFSHVLWDHFRSLWGKEAGNAFIALLVVFTPTHLVMLQTAVRNVQMVLTWHMTRNLENLYWTARHVLTEQKPIFSLDIVLVPVWKDITELISSKSVLHVAEAGCNAKMSMPH